MKRLFIITVMMLMLVTVTTSVSAKPKKDKKVEALYIFGMAASFNDSTVYVTDIQQIRNVWMDGKKRLPRPGSMTLGMLICPTSSFRLLTTTKKNATVNALLPDSRI